MKIFLFLLLFFYSIFVHSQNTFTKRINLSMTNTQLISPVKGNGYYFCLGSIETNGNLIIGKIDSIGSLEWVKQIDNHPYLLESVDLITIQNGNAVAMFNHLENSIKTTRLISFDSTGNFIFSKIYTNPTSAIQTYGMNLIPDETGFCMAVDLSVSANETHLLKADSLGVTLATSSIYGSDQFLFKNRSGKYLVVANYGSSISVFDQNLVYQNTISSQGDLGGFHADGIIEPSPNVYLIYGSQPGVIAILDSSFNMQSLKIIDTPGGFFGIFIDAGVQIDNDKFAFYGYTALPDCKPLIFETNLAGDLLKCKYLPTISTHNYFYPAKMVFKNEALTFSFNDSGNYFKIFSVDTTLSQFCNALDTTLILTNDSNFFTIQGPLAPTFSSDILQDDLFIIQDIMVNYGECNDSTIGITKYENKLSKISAFPNPFIDKITISSEEQIFGEIELYDMQKRKLFSGIFNNSITIETAHLSPGMYVYKLKSKSLMDYWDKIIKN